MDDSSGCWVRSTPRTIGPARVQLRLVSSCVAAVVLAVSVAVGGSAAAITRPTAAVTRPSKKAKMVCAKEAQGDIAGVLATKPTAVTKPTWIDQLYSCTYRYPDGSFTVSVKQLPDRTRTIGYFQSLGAALNRLPDDVSTGDGAFLAPNGSMVVRKDNNVLEIDASNLPARFAKLHLAPSDVASSVAMTILGCWKG